MQGTPVTNKCTPDQLLRDTQVCLTKLNPLLHFCFLFFSCSQCSILFTICNKRLQHKFTAFSLIPLLMSLSKLERPSPPPDTFLSLFASTFFKVIPLCIWESKPPLPPPERGGGGGTPPGVMGGGGGGAGAPRRKRFFQLVDLYNCTGGVSETRGLDKIILSFDGFCVC